MFLSTPKASLISNHNDNISLIAKNHEIVKFSLPNDAKNVSIVIVDDGGNLQDRVELGSLKAGEHSISWQPKKTGDSGKFYYFAVIADGKQVDSGRFSPAGKK